MWDPQMDEPDSVLPSEEIVNIIKTKFAITPSKSNYKGEVAEDEMIILIMKWVLFLL